MTRAPYCSKRRDLSVAYGKVEALHKVSLTIREGEIVTVIGPNGAGKTTLLSCLMGLLPGQGAVSYVGRLSATISKSKSALVWA